MIQTIGLKEIACLIRTEELNFIATAITPWHAHGVDCCILKLIDDGVDVSGIVLIQMHAVSGYIINESHFSNTQCSVYFVEKPVFEGVFVEIKTMMQKFNTSFKFKQNSQTNSQIYLASSWHINLDLFAKLNKHVSNCTFSFIVFEEGLSTYYPSSESANTIWKDSGVNKALFKHIFSFIFRVFNKYLQSFVEKKIPFMNMNIFTQRGKGLMINDVSNKYYSRMFKGVFSDNDQKYSQVFDNSIIICTMAIPRDEINIDLYISLLKQVIDCLANKGVRIVLKPHPRELDYKKMYSGLDCILFDEKDLSLESIMTIYNIKSVIGFSSTSLITSSLLFNIKSISLLSLIESNNYGPRIRREMKEFKDIFSEFVFMPNSLNELIEIIKPSKNQIQ